MTTHRSTAALACAALWAGLSCLPAHALTQGLPSSAFDAVGTVQGASAVLIDDHWALTAAHVARSADAGTFSFSSDAGTAVVDAVYLAGTGAYPGDDLALLHLSSALDTASLPLLNGLVYTAGQAAQLGPLTLVSDPGSATREVAHATALTAADTYTDSTGTRFDTHWLLTQGTAYVEAGDSGSAAFLGSVGDSTGSVLAGIASAQITSGDGTHYSAYVQVGAYRSWIDSTLASTGDATRWTTPVPEAPGVCLALIGLPLVSRRRR